MLLLPFVKGLILMMSVIVAIGPQNAFLLRQAIRHEKAWLTASIFLLGDVTMVILGGVGIGHLLAGWPWAKLVLTSLGAVYVFWFGVNVCRHIRNPKALVAEKTKGSRAILSRALVVTFLNPHAIFDTVILVGTLTLQFHHAAKYFFMLGAVSGSTIWFFGLAWIGQRLAPVLARREVWRAIDGFIAGVMFILSASLAFDAWHQWRLLLS